MNMKKRKIAIVAGGDSSEYEVSLRSATGILSWIDTDKYEAQIVELKGADKATLNSLTDYDFVYITIHGTPGENGLLQGYLEMMRIPYSCCNVLAASLTFNKFTCNHYLHDFGINIAESILLRRFGKRPSDEEIVKTIGLPCFIKSNVGGSSFGCTKVKTIEQVSPAIDFAFKEGDEVICESLLVGTEVTCGMYKTSNRTVIFPVTEVVTDNEFFDYDAKYNGQVQEITPARIPDEQRDQVQALTDKIYDLIGCAGLIRADFIIAKNGEISLLEVNTTPGTTPTSFIPQQVRAAGMEMKDVLTEIIEDQIKRKQ